MNGIMPTLEPVQEDDDCFRPSDHKLVNHFLKLMLQGHRHLVHRIPEVDIYQYEPWELPSRSGMRPNCSEWLFFCRRHEMKGDRYARLTKGGQWKSTGQDRDIKDEITKKVIGKKKSLIYFIGRAKDGFKTDWKIHEYRATLGLSNQGEFVICKLMYTPDMNGNVFTDDKSECSDITSDYDNRSPDANTSLPNYNEGYGSGYGNMATCNEGGKPNFQMYFDYKNQNSYQNIAYSAYNEYQPCDDNQSPEANTNLPCYNEGYGSGHGNMATSHEGCQLNFQMDFDYQNQNSDQNIAYPAYNEPAIGHLMTSAYHNNSADIMFTEEAIGQQQPASLFGRNDHQCYSQNSELGSYMPMDNSLFIAVHDFGNAPPVPNEAGRLLNGGGEHTYTFASAAGTQLQTEQGLSDDEFNEFSSLSGYFVNGLWT